jgi:hypothetical protein
VTDPNPIIFIFDTSGLVALFEAEPRAMWIWQRANHGHAVVLAPASAIVEASRVAEISESAWEAVLFPLTVVPLDSAAAMGIIETAERYDIAHVAWEAERTRAIVATRTPAPYRWRKLPVIVLGGRRP